MREYRTISDDFDAIDAAIIRDRVAHLAEIARRDETSSVLAVVEDDDFIDVPDYKPPRRDVTAVPIEYFDDRTWWQRVDKLVLFLRVLGVLAVVSACLGLVWVVMAIITAVTTALAAAIPVILGVLGAVALVMLLASLGGGGGRGFSGTFSGRMH